MRVLLINIYFHPDPTGTGLMMTELATGLAARGHEVVAVTAFPHYGCDRLPPRYRWRWLEVDSYQGVRILRTHVFVSPGQSRLHRLLNYLSFSISGGLTAVRAGPFDVVFACSPPLTTGVVGARVARFKGAPLVFNPQDIYPDVAVKLGFMRNTRVIRAMVRMERFIYERSDRVVVISEAAKGNLLGKGVPPDRVEVIENWADMDLLRPTDGDGFRKQNGLVGKRIVMYSGNIGLVHGLRNVVDCADVMRGEGDVAFVIVGEGNAKAEVMACARDKRAANVRFLPTQPREQFSSALGAADLCLVTLGKGMSTSSVPSKAYGIMAAGRPMLAAVDEGSEIWRLVREVGCGVCVPPDDPVAMAEAVRQMLRDRDRSAAYGAAGRAYVVGHNEREAQVARSWTGEEWRRADVRQ